ncbi:MAG: cobalamin adenosyltransferase [Clostridiaceae bacterium]
MMKFITEEYLRDLYKKEPFNTYELNQGERLTPGARQYLSDRGIKMLNEVSCNNKKISEVKQSKTLPVGNNNNKKKLCYKLKSVEALFLVTSSDILNEDIILAQNIIALGKKITNIRKFIEGKSQLESLSCQECAGINSTNFYDGIDDCFEITEFYVQLEKSKEILKLHTLRCVLHELDPYVIEVYEEDDNNLGKEVIKNINSIINSLSQMICSIIGGKRCQRNN